jgi:hypothetical protein
LKAKNADLGVAGSFHIQMRARDVYALWNFFEKYFDFRQTHLMASICSWAKLMKL